MYKVKLMFLDQAFRFAIHRSARLSGASAAEELGISQTSFNAFQNWRKTGKFPSEDLAIKIAEYIDWLPEDMLLSVLSARQAYKGRDTMTDRIEKTISAPDFTLKASESKEARKLKKDISRNSMDSHMRQAANQ